MKSNIEQAYKEAGFYERTAFYGRLSEKTSVYLFEICNRRLQQDLSKEMGKNITLYHNAVKLTTYYPNYDPFYFERVPHWLSKDYRATIAVARSLTETNEFSLSRKRPPVVKSRLNQGLHALVRSCLEFAYCALEIEALFYMQKSAVNKDIREEWGREENERRLEYSKKQESYNQMCLYHLSFEEIVYE